MPLQLVPVADGQRVRRASAISTCAGDDKRPIDEVVAQRRWEAAPVSFLRQRGVTYHFCPECGSTVYYEITAAPDFVGVAIGNMTDPTFPPPIIAGFEAYRHPWSMTVSDLPMEHHD